ncbi:MAG: hypothetical protein IPM63_00265 [Acidobacteriota bacterium]|nr:MAG: hypothetical protein IPM63_00265 [Acidobacteriota bacterium]
MKRVTALSLVLILAVVILPACSYIFSPEGSEEKVLAIRTQIAKKQFGRIYDEASTEFKAKVRKEDFERLLSDLPPEVGDPERFRRTDGSANYDWEDGFHVVLSYAPVGESSLEMEEYIFVKENDEWKLFNYRIVSKSAEE